MTLRWLFLYFPIISISYPPISKRLYKNDKYSADKSSTLLVKMIRSSEVSCFLSDRGSLSQSSKIVFKSYLSFAERKVESILLRERRSPNLEQIQRTCKLRNPRLLVGRKPDGKVQGFLFAPVVANDVATINTCTSQTRI